MSHAAKLIDQIIEGMTMSRVLPELNRLAKKFKGRLSSGPSKPFSDLPYEDYELKYQFPSVPLAAQFAEVGGSQLERAGAKVYGIGRDVWFEHVRNTVTVTFYNAR